MEETRIVKRSKEVVSEADKITIKELTKEMKEVYEEVKKVLDRRTELLDKMNELERNGYETIEYFEDEMVDEYDTLKEFEDLAEEFHNISRKLCDCWL